MSTSTIDYEALAKQNGAISSMPAPKAGGKLDYAALAKQNGAIESKAAPSQPAPIPILEGYQKTGAAILNFGKNLASTVGGMLPNIAPGPTDILTGAANAVSGGIESFEKAKAEGKAASESSSPSAAAAHRIGQAGYTATGLLAPVGGKAIEGAGEQFGRGDISGGLGTTAGLLAPIGAAHLTPAPKPVVSAADVLPKHVEALTGLIEDKGGTVDPHETASAALPHLRETAVRMKVDPSQLKGREAGQATLKVAEQAVRDTQDEFNTIKKPYENVLVDQKPIADAYRAAITPELLANEPSVATALEKQAKKFDQPAPLEQVNQFRTRMNNQLDAFEKRGQTAQIMSDIETKAMKAAANAARDVEYSTVGRMSGIDPEYVRALKQKEGSLIEAKSSLEKEYNRASGAQGEAVSKSILQNPSMTNLKDKAASTYPSPRGTAKAGLKSFIAPKPIAILNERIRQMFADMGTASPLPEYQQVMPPEAPQPQGGASGPLPGGEDAIEEATRGGPGIQPPAAPDTSQTFVRPSRMGTQQGIADQVTAAKSGKTNADMSRVDQHKVSKAAIGEQQQLAPAKAIYEMSPDELETKAKSDLAKGNAIIDRVFGEDAAKYRRLQEQAGDPSKSFDETRRLTEQMNAMEKTLSPELRKILYREDERSLEHGDYINFRNALMRVSGDTPQELGHSMRHAVTNLGDADLHDPEGMSLNQQQAYAQLRHGFQRATEDGFDTNEVWQAAVKWAAKKFRDPADAAFMLQRFTKDAPQGPRQLKQPVAPVKNGQITQAHVDAENAFYTQVRAELGANAEPSAVLARAQALKIEHVAKGANAPTTPVPSTVRPTLTQKMQSQPLPKLKRVEMPAGGPQSPSGASRQSQAALIMLQAKQGLISPQEADSRIQKLVGSGGRRTMRMPVRAE